jgi:hypothetical protein
MSKTVEEILETAGLNPKEAAAWFAVHQQKTIERYLAEGRVYGDAKTKDMLKQWKAAMEIVAENPGVDYCVNEVRRTASELALRDVALPVHAIPDIMRHHEARAAKALEAEAQDDPEKLRQRIRDEIRAAEMRRN